MGSSSPTAPAAKTNRPNVPASMCWSRRIGSSVPRAVVVNAIDDRHERPHEAEVCQAADDQHRRDGADRPGDQGLPAGLFPQQRGFQLVSGEQEQESQAQARDQFDVVGVGESRARGVRSAPHR